LSNHTTFFGPYWSALDATFIAADYTTIFPSNCPTIQHAFVTAIFTTNLHSFHATIYPTNFSSLCSTHIPTVWATFLSTLWRTVKSA
jgi:hypothetical protein